MITSKNKMLLRTLFILLLWFSGLNLKAQLNNTVWLGELKMPFPMECHYSFHLDTARLSMMETDEDFETMHYRTKEDTLFITKIRGISPCSTEIEAAYSFRIEGNKLYLKPLDDNCKDRAFAFPDTLTKMTKEW